MNDKMRLQKIQERAAKSEAENQKRIRAYFDKLPGNMAKLREMIQGDGEEFAPEEDPFCLPALTPGDVDETQFT